MDKIKVTQDDINYSIEWSDVYRSLIFGRYETFESLISRDGLNKYKRDLLPYWSTFIMADDIRFTIWFLQSELVNEKMVFKIEVFINIDTETFSKYYFKNYTCILNYLEARRMNKRKYFICEDADDKGNPIPNSGCGEIPYVLFEGGQFGERMLEFIMFKMIIKDNEIAVEPVDDWDTDRYLKQLNKKYWLEQAYEYALKLDCAECPNCKNQDIDAQPREEVVSKKYGS